MNTNKVACCLSRDVSFEGFFLNLLCLETQIGEPLLCHCSTCEHNFLEDQMIIFCNFLQLFAGHKMWAFYALILTVLPYLPSSLCCLLFWLTVFDDTKWQTKISQSQIDYHNCIWVGKPFHKYLYFTSAWSKGYYLSPDFLYGLPAVEYFPSLNPLPFIEKNIYVVECHCPTLCMPLVSITDSDGLSTLFVNSPYASIIH